MKKARILLSAALAATLSLGFVSCSSDDDDNNSSANNNQVTDENVVDDDASAIALVNGVYSHWQPMSSSFSFIIESAFASSSSPLKYFDSISTIVEILLSTVSVRRPSFGVFELPNS